MWKRPSIAANGILWIIGIAIQVGGWINQLFAIILLVIAGLWTIASLLSWQLSRRKGKKGGVPDEETLLLLDVGKLFHEGKDILAELEKINIERAKMIRHDSNQWTSMGELYAMVHFEAWFGTVSKALADTPYSQIWYERKMVDYRKDQIADYVEVCKRALDRLKDIQQLVQEDKNAEGRTRNPDISNRLSKHFEDLDQTAKALLALIERLYKFKDDGHINTHAITEVQYWSKGTGLPICGHIPSEEEFMYEKQEEINMYLADCLLRHFKDRLSEIPLSSWQHLRIKYISQERINTMRLIAHGGSAMPCLDCDICQDIRKSHSTEFK